MGSDLRSGTNQGYPGRREGGTDSFRVSTAAFFSATALAMRQEHGTLRCIAGPSRPSLGGSIPSRRPAARRQAADIGATSAVGFQDYALFPHRPCSTTSRSAWRLGGKDRAEVEERVGSGGSRRGLSRGRRKLSGDSSPAAMQQRVASPRALVLEPRLLCWYEPALQPQDLKLRAQSALRAAPAPAPGAPDLHLCQHDQNEALA